MSEDPFEVENQAPPLEDYNAFELDLCLRETVEREGGGWIGEEAGLFGGIVGSAQTARLVEDAERYAPVLHSHDRYGRRVDRVEFHSAYHRLMGLAFGKSLHCLPWTSNRPGSHVARAALFYLFNLAENGVSCPVSMAYAAVPVLRREPQVAEEWLPRVTAKGYDASDQPASRKTAATIAMAMTEKQGGSDLRTNRTRACSLNGAGSGAEYLLEGHKWFCSAPMSDAYLTLAQAEGGLSCFLVPRYRPDGSRNAVRLQRLKDKCGNRSNASGEIEYHGAWAQMVGEEGRGIPTIIEMVALTRLDCALGTAGLLRHALCEAIHHAGHRSSFGARLIEHSLMRQVLAELAVESEAATTVVLRLVRALDESEQDPAAANFLRLALPVIKYWLCKRAPGFVAEALECHGGNGYIEEGPMARLYREAPLNGIWEGSGNIICLDVLRAMRRTPESIEAFFDELRTAKGQDARYDQALVQLVQALSRPVDMEARARYLIERMALLLQGALLLRFAPAEVADAFCALHLEEGYGRTYGARMPQGKRGAILERAWPPLA